MRFLPAGDRALVVEFGDRVDRALNAEVLRLDAVLRAEPPTGIVETVPTFRSLMVHYDPSATSRADLERTIAGFSTAARGRRCAMPGAGKCRSAMRARSPPISKRWRA